MEPWTSHAHIAAPAPHSRRVLERFVADCHTVKGWADRHFQGLISGVDWNPDEAQNSRCIVPKPFASIYIDDKAWPLRGGPVNWLDVERDMEERGVS
jgi:hypothetical protein